MFTLCCRMRLTKVFMKNSLTENQLQLDGNFAITATDIKETATPKNEVSQAGGREKSTPGTLMLIGTFIVLLAGALLVYILQPQFEELYRERMTSIWGKALIIVSLSLLAVRSLFFLYDLVLYFKYKPIASVSDEALPTCTVIVPAYNEGKLVYHTLMSLAESDYPQHKLQLIAIDDGSKDDTWSWIQEAKTVLGDRLAIHKQPKNMGKRHALYHGFTTGHGDVFVTVDSDSIVKPDTLRNLVSPVVVNPDCGAVAGNVRVLNARKGIIPRMLKVNFVLSFEFIRSAESALGSVFCTPGALAAYRREAVLNCLPEWINQKFMGRVSDIGEDRAMTNMILKQGYKVLFQKNAYVLTDVPEKYKGLYKMFIRWGRSNVRENLKMAKFIFTDFRKGPKLGTRLLFINQLLTFILVYPFFLLMFFLLALNPVLFVSSTLLGIFVFSSFPVFFYAKMHNNLKDSLYAYSYSLMYTFALFWITPYAIATARKRGWLTRELPAGS